MQNSKNNWHALDIKDILNLLNTQEEGLSEEEAKTRLAEYGYNHLVLRKPRSWVKRFFSQFQSLLIYILFVAVVLTLFLQKWIDASVIFSVVLLDALIGFFQEGKAEKALEAVRQILPLEAIVIRHKRRFVTRAERLVPGDIVFLQPGDKVSADLRLIKAKNLKINEALLTGESESVEKNLQVLPQDTSVSDRANMAFSGTFVRSGHAVGVVVGTGEDTEIGRISELLAEVEPPTTPLLRKMEKLSLWLSIVILSIAALIFIFGIFIYRYSLDSMLIAVVGIAVASIPEGLPIILTITLAIGVQRMARRHAIIHNLPAVETLGSVSVICTDKTGTLTCNQMTVIVAYMASGPINISGVGYEARGDFSFHEQVFDVASRPDFLEFCQASMLCNEAEFHVNEEIELQGDSTECALLVLGMKAGLVHGEVRKQWPVTDTIPFESEHRLMATLHHDHYGNGVIYIKGAPEVIFSRCHKERDGQGESKVSLDYWHESVSNITNQGQRALAIAYKAASAEFQRLRFSDIKADFILLGIVGIMDPPREGALEAIQECRSAGIHIKMITGDHAKTAVAIASKMGIGDGVHVLTGKELEPLSEEAFSEKADRVDVFARISPAYKLRLVQSLQAHDCVVAMTGDGVNDAPALKRADIGIAMGLGGSEAAKEASEMILTDNNFASIVTAVKEGRTVFDNLKKVILFLLPINGAESASLMIAILLGYTMPITPLQILWVNLVSSIVLTMVLAFEPSEPYIMSRSPTPAHQSFITPLLLWRIVWVTFVFSVGIFGVFEWARYQGLDLQTSRTLAVNTLVILEVFYLFSARYVHGASLTWRGIRGTRAVLIAVGLVFLLQVLFTYTPAMQFLFETVSLTFMQSLLIGLIGLTGFAILEIDKLICLGIKRRLGE